MQVDNESNRLLASLVVFRDIYDKHKDVYIVISEFINEIITSRGLSRFTLSSIYNSLNSIYGFTIPKAVINDALKRLDVYKNDGYFYVRKKSSDKSQDLLRQRNDRLSSNKILGDHLITYVEQECNKKLSKEEKANLVNSFCSFLLNDTSTKEYSEYISAFTILHQNERFFRDSLNKIREGVILFTGINYCNLGKIGYWNSPLTIFLDTEILFHLAGLNGEICRTGFEDFYRFVEEINSNAVGELVKLRYFPEVYNAIENFYFMAEQIVLGTQPFNPTKTAMVSILDGCKTPSDVQFKKSDFFQLLNSRHIKLMPPPDLIENHSLNNISAEIVERLANQNKSEMTEMFVTETLEQFNYISILRGAEKPATFEECKYIIVTGKGKKLQLAWDKEILQKGLVPLATSLFWITNQFWFKLNKGFGNGRFPSSFDVITKAQIVLSADLSKSIEDDYDNLVKSLAEGTITDEKAKAGLMFLRSNIKNPEEIGIKEVTTVLDVLTGDSLDNFVEQYEDKLLKYKQERITKLAESIKTSRDYRSSLELLVDHKEEAIQEDEKNHIFFEGKVRKKITEIKALSVGVLILILLALLYLNYARSINLIDVLSLSILIGWISTIIGKEVKLKDAVQSIERNVRKGVFDKGNFDFGLKEKLVAEKTELLARIDQCDNSIARQQLELESLSAD